MKLRLLAVGKAPRWVEEGFAQYAQRLPADCALQLTVVSPRRGQSDEERLLAEVRPREIAVVFDRRGRSVSSEGLAKLLAEWRQSGRDVALLVGGLAGFDDEACGRAEHVLSLSALTFPHLLSRVVVAEQVYRAWTILRGHPYHLAQADS